MSSGAVGAAVEGGIAGIPAIAHSVGRNADDRGGKRQRERSFWNAPWQRVTRVGADGVSDVREHGFSSGVDLLSVNFQLEADLETPHIVTQLAPLGYDRLFHRRETGRFAHDFDGTLRGAANAHAETDGTVVRRGRVSIAPVRLAHAAAIDDETRAKLEKRACRERE